jgi:thymidylate kinase
VNWCTVSDQGLPRPDIVVLLDAEVDNVKQRKNFGLHDVSENVEFLKMVKEGYKRFEKYHYWKIIDGNQKKDKIHKEIVSQVESLINDYKRGGDDFENNFYPYSVGEDLFMYNNI